MIYEGKVTLNATPLDVWTVVLDAEQFAACMPGVEDLSQLDDHTFDGAIRAQVGPLSGSFSFRASIVESSPPTELAAHVEGADSMTDSRVTSEIAMTLAASGPAQMELAYRVVVDIHGRLAIIGDMVLRATGAQMIEEFFNRLRARVEGATV